MGGLGPGRVRYWLQGLPEVGSVAVMLLSQLGYEVVAVTEAEADWLKSAWRVEVLSREALAEGAGSPSSQNASPLR